MGKYSKTQKVEIKGPKEVEVEITDLNREQLSGIAYPHNRLVSMIIKDLKYNKLTVYRDGNLVIESTDLVQDPLSGGMKTVKTTLSNHNIANKIIQQYNGK